MSANPARVGGVFPKKGSIRPGADADIVIVNFDAPDRPVRSTLADAWETWPGVTTRLSIDHVLLRGIERVKDNALSDPDHPAGECLCKKERS